MEIKTEWEPLTRLLAEPGSPCGTESSRKSIIRQGIPTDPRLSVSFGPTTALGKTVITWWRSNHKGNRNDYLVLGG